MTYNRIISATLILSGIALLAYGCCTAPPGVIDYSVTVATALCFVTACTLLNVELKLPSLK